MIKDLKNLNKFITYLEETEEEDWCINVIRNRDNTKNCLFGHLINWYYGKNYKDTISDVVDLFEERWATTYMVYPVNDGKNSKYQQETPKQRCIAYLKNLNRGKERTTQQLMEDAAMRSKLLAEAL